MTHDETVGRPLEILLVEDDLEDAGLTIEALKGSRIRCRVTLVRDGEEAMRFLHKADVFARAPRPDLVLLDINLPRMSGADVLAKIRADEALARMAVVVLTASEAHREVLEDQRLSVDHYMTKPVDLPQFLDAIRALRRTLLADIVLPDVI